MPGSPPPRPWPAAVLIRQVAARVYADFMSMPAHEPAPEPELEAEDALRGVVNQLIINGRRMPVIIPGSVIEALRVFADLVAYADEAGVLRELLLRAMPWAEPLPENALGDFISGLADAARSGEHAPERIAAVLREWQATAEVYADPDGADRLRQALRETHEGKATPWVYDDASI